VERWFVAQLAVVLAYLPWLSVFAVQFTHVQSGFWIPEPGWHSVGDLAETYAGSDALAWLLVPLAAWGLILAWRRTRVEGRAAPDGAVTPPAPGTILLPWLLMPIVLPLLLSLVGSPVFLPKYTIAASVPFALLVGDALASFPRLLRAAVLVVTVVLSGIALTDYYSSSRKDDWRGAVRALESRARPGDAVVFYPWFTQIPWDLYRRRQDLHLIPFPEHAEVLTTTALPWVLEATVTNQPRAWLVVMQWDGRKGLLVKQLESRFEAVERIRAWHIDLYQASAPRGRPSPSIAGILRPSEGFHR
jgi:hypothetical protein